MLDLLTKVNRILTKREKRRLCWLLLAVVGMAFFQVIGIASLLPFMRLISHPDALQTNENLRWIYEHTGAQNTREFLLMVGTTVLILMTITSVISVVTLWLQYHFVWDSAHSLAMRLLRNYIYQPYEFFFQNNTSRLGKQVLSEVNEVVRAVLLPMVSLVVHSFMSLAIFSFLLVISPRLAAILFVVLGGAYALIYIFSRKYMLTIGRERFKAAGLRFTMANEALASMKTVKINGCEDFFLGRFAKASRRYTTIQPRFQVMSQAPRYFIELTAFGGMLIIILYLLAVGQGLRDAIPLLSIYAFAGYRALPSLQHIFKSANSIRFNYPAVEAIYNDLESTQRTALMKYSSNTAPLTFGDSIRTFNLTFKYPGSGELAIRNIELVIPKNSSVAFVGPTGSGKTTLVDLITGLLRPQSGAVLIDNIPLTDANAQRWQRSIGYVPQEVVLYDDTLARNIAYGVPDDQIDLARVHHVAEIACIHSFIRDLPEGYDTTAGERGIRLSGGQRQRIGLARALYHGPSVLVLDEATSALDGITEEAVMRAIRDTGYGITMIMIAHRLATVSHCDFIYLLDNGRIVAEGRYQDLIETNAIFQGMARAAS